MMRNIRIILVVRIYAVTLLHLSAVNGQMCGSFIYEGIVLCIVLERWTFGGYHFMQIVLGTTTTTNP